MTNERAQVQTDIGSALGAFAAAGKDLTCITEADGNDEVLAAVEKGTIYASVALQFQDAMVQEVDHIASMLKDLTADGEQISVPQKVIKTEG